MRDGSDAAGGRMKSDPAETRLSDSRVARSTKNRSLDSLADRETKSRPASAAGFAVFLVAVLLWAASLFAVGEAVRNQSVLATELDRTGRTLDVAQLLSFLFILGWFGRNLFLSPPGESPLDYFNKLIVEPEHLTPGILLGVFPPVVIGLMKLVAGIGFVQRGASGEIERRNWVWINSTYLCVLLILGISAALLLHFQL
jgi:uncharacterized membrane protein